MSVAYQTETHSTVLSATTVVDRPTGVADGDVLVVALGADGNVTGTSTIDTPASGWTLLQSETSNGNSSYYVYWKVASSEPSTWTWTWSNANVNKSWACFRFDNTTPSSQIPVSAIDYVNNDDTPSWNNTITPTTAGSMIVMLGYSVQNNNAASSAHAIVTNNPTWTSVLDVDYGSERLFMVYANRPETTATGNSSATLGAVTTVDSKCVLLSISRKVDFTTTIADTTTVTDTDTSVQQNKIVTISDTTTVTDSIVSTLGRIWRTVNKPVTTWTNRTK